MTTITSGLSKTMRAIAGSLQYPVIAFLLLLVAATVILLGFFI